MQTKGYEVTGIDYSRELTKIAQAQYPDITFVEGDFTELPFIDNSFDAIYCNAALVHLPSMALVERALSEFHRVLRAGGYILICTKARLAGQPETAVKKDPLSDRERYFRYQDKANFLTLCEQAGLAIIKHEVFNEKDHQYAVRRDENWVWVLAQKPKK